MVLGLLLPPLLQRSSSIGVPAAILPVFFLVPETSSRLLESPPIPDINCPGTDCHYAKNTTYMCVCNNDARSTTPVGSSDPQGRCSNDEFHDTVCLELGIGCPEW